MKITKLEYQKKDPNRVNIYVDDKFVAGLDANDILKLDLYKGKEIEATDIPKIIESSNFGKLFNKALNFISYRPRSEWEVRFKFRTEDPQNVDKIVDRLKLIGQLNDENFVKWFIDQRSTFKPKGKHALRFELAHKGVSREIVDKALQEDTSSEFELALLAASKKTRLKDPDKLTRFLASRGFGWETIRLVVEKTLKKEYDIDS